MNVDRVTYFDDIKLGDVLIYDADPEFQADAERGKVISKTHNEFIVEWEESSDVPVSYYRREDAMLDWELYKVVG